MGDVGDPVRHHPPEMILRGDAIDRVFGDGVDGLATRDPDLDGTQFVEIARDRRLGDVLAPLVQGRDQFFLVVDPLDPEDLNTFVYTGGVFPAFWIPIDVYGAGLEVRAVLRGVQEGSRPLLDVFAASRESAIVGIAGDATRFAEIGRRRRVESGDQAL